MKRLLLILTGGCFGILFAIYEMILGYIPMVWRWSQMRIYGEELIFTAGFHLCFFSIASIPFLFFPEKVRRVEIIIPYSFIIVALVTFLGSQKVEVVIFMRFASAIFSSATLYGIIKLWKSGGKATRYSIVTTCLVVGMIPFVLLGFGSAVPEASEVPVTREVIGKPNIIIVVYDTVNRNHLSTYGYQRNTSLTFDKVARSGAKFNRLYTTSNWTVSSHASMFTGRFSSAHGATHEHPYLSPSEWTLAEELMNHGYQTAGFSCNPWVSHGTGLSQGFNVFREIWRGQYRNEIYLIHRFWSIYFNHRKDKGGALLVKSVRDWVNTISHKRPYFLFVNLMEAHTPYHQIPEQYARFYLREKLSRSQMAAVGAESVALQLFWRTGLSNKTNLRHAIAMYDGGIRYDDELAGKILEILGGKGLLENTIIIFLTDHGELFGEHGLFGHEVSLYEPLPHIAMAISWKGKISPGLEINDLMSINDLYPTLLEIIGISSKSNYQIHGSRKTALLTGKGSNEKSTVIAESFKPLHLSLSWKYNHPFHDAPEEINQRWIAMWDENMKFIKVFDSSGNVSKRMLFDVLNDPDEIRNIAFEKADVAEMFNEKLNRIQTDWKIIKNQSLKHFVPSFDEEMKERLRNLGYIGH